MAGASNDEYVRRSYDNVPHYNGYDLDRNVHVHVTPVTSVYGPTVTPPMSHTTPTQYPRAYGYDVMPPQTSSSGGSAYPRFVAVGASTAPDEERYDDDEEFVSTESSQESSSSEEEDANEFADDEDEYAGATQLNYLDTYYQVDILINKKNI
jgi:hypothetical protein